MKEEIIIHTIKGLWSYASGCSNIDLTSFNYLTPNTWEAYNKYLNFYGQERLVPIYFELDKETRLQRALNREQKSKNSDYAKMCRRFLAEEEDFTKKLVSLYQPIIIDNNGSMEDTLEQIDDVFVRKSNIRHKYE